MRDRHPIVGAWRVAVVVPGASTGLVNLATIAADGTMIVGFPSPTPAAFGTGHRLEYWSPAFGSWTTRDARNVSMSFVALGTDENGASVGTHTVTAEVSVAADGQRGQGPFRIAVAGVDGSIRASVDGTVTATRIVVAR